MPGLIFRTVQAGTVRIAFIINTADVEALGVLRQEAKRLRENGHEVEAHLTFEGGDAQRFARQAAVNRAELIIAAGGDGTVNEIANGLDEHQVHQEGTGRGGHLPPRLGIVPLGTANDLAASLGIPRDPAEALFAALNGAAIAADVAKVNGRCFLNVSTGGFGAEATEETPAEVKRALGPLAYLITGVKKFATLEASSARFFADKLLYDGPFLLFAVGNARRTGGGNLLTPRADMCDGLLDICIVKEVPRVEFLALLPDLRNGRHLGHPAVIYEQVRALTVNSEVELSVNADGEPIAASSFEYQINPQRLLLVRPGHRQGRGAGIATGERRNRPAG